MQNLKIRVNNEQESKEAQELFFELGATLGNGDRHAVMVTGAIGLAVIDGLINFVFNQVVHSDITQAKEITLPELREMVNQDQDEPFLTPETTLNDQYAEIEQERQTIKASWPSIDMQRIENVAKAAKAVADSWPSIVEGAKAKTEIHGTAKAKPDFNFGEAHASGGVKKDNVNHPSHYTQGKVECIDALESATIGKSGIEAVCVANVIKYLWRYEEKNGLEDVKKAQFYLNRLLANLENNNG